MTAYKSGFAALIGRPNVGKSTLMNALIGQKIAITSAKPQTTRNQIRTIYTDERGQIVFVDTPGIHQAKNKLGEYMVMAAERSLKDVDVIIYLVEPNAFIGEIDRRILQQLRQIRTPKILVINKIDTIQKERVLPVIDRYRKELSFDEIIPLSALKNRGTDDLIDSIYRYLPEGPALYDEDAVTDQPVRAIVSELIREKALRCLDEEVPHGIAVAIDRMEWRKGAAIWDIDATIICEKDSHKGIIIGKKGAMLKKIGSAARYEAERLLDAKVNLKIWVKVKKEWRQSDYLVRNFGYDKKEIGK